MMPMTPPVAPQVITTMPAAPAPQAFAAVAPQAVSAPSQTVRVFTRQVASLPLQTPSAVSRQSAPATALEPVLTAVAASPAAQPQAANAVAEETRTVPALSELHSASQFWKPDTLPAMAFLQHMSSSDSGSVHDSPLPADGLPGIHSTEHLSAAAVRPHGTLESVLPGVGYKSAPGCCSPSGAGVGL